MTASVCSWFINVRTALILEQTKQKANSSNRWNAVKSMQLNIALKNSIKKIQTSKVAFKNKKVIRASNLKMIMLC